jgi:hypothetical protein
VAASRLTIRCTGRAQLPAGARFARQPLWGAPVSSGSVRLHGERMDWFTLVGWIAVFLFGAAAVRWLLLRLGGERIAKLHSVQANDGAFFLVGLYALALIGVGNIAGRISSLQQLPLALLVVLAGLAAAVLAAAFVAIGIALQHRGWRVVDSRNRHAA